MIVVKVGAYHPPIQWEAATAIYVNPSQWQKVVAAVRAKGEMEKFKVWVVGKVIVFTRRGVLTSATTIKEIS